MNTAEKHCFKCATTKPLSEFCVMRNRVKLGVQSACKECNREYRKANRERIKAKDAAYAKLPKQRLQRQLYAKTERGKLAMSVATRRQRDKFPEKNTARQKMTYAIKYGHLIKQPCERCGSLKVEGHHEDYSKPLEVMWLCRKHHQERHFELGWGWSFNATPKSDTTQSS